MAGTTPLECPVCKEPCNTDKLRSLPCGHIICCDCIENWLDALEEKEESPTCPLCRDSFEYDDIRRVFFSFAADAPTETGDEAIVAHADNIAKKLRRIKVDSQVRSVAEAATQLRIIASAMGNSERAQGIIWDAVQDLWTQTVVPLFKERRDQEGLARTLHQRVLAAEKKASDAQYQADLHTQLFEKHRKRYLNVDAKIESLQEKVEQFRIALNDAERAAQEESAKFKQELSAKLGMLDELKRANRKRNADYQALSKINRHLEKENQRLLEAQEHHEQAAHPQEESLYIEPPKRGESSRHVLDVYNEEERGVKRRKISGNSEYEYLRVATGSPAQSSHFSTSESPSRSPSPLVEPRYRINSKPLAKPASQRTADPTPQRPRFASDWSLAPPPTKGKPPPRPNAEGLPFPVDRRGRAKVPLQLGPRQRMVKR
ncbi:hypothetical protein FA95DRAFT_945613 [Auriscalpium vulgare]|uniref:Uncharacterized protein n=1 Tax=Auriscalpium vulgare TaxID=40419 RepID=A0ACB8SAP3_9AGAM|nr:hypothetical protein FA95DRAFT_945613 [Auriscalpium vulgare]